MDWFDFTRAELTASVVGGLVVFVLLALPRVIFRVIGWASAINTRWSLSINRAERDRLKIFLEDRSALRDYMQQQLLWCVALIGAAIMFIPLVVMTRGFALVSIVWLVIGFLIYAIALMPLGIVYRLRHAPERTIARLTERIQVLEEKLSRRQ